MKFSRSAENMCRSNAPGLLGLVLALGRYEEWLLREPAPPAARAPRQDQGQAPLSPRFAHGLPDGSR
ncbi:hypothetical protein JCM4814A_02210 [Streptomyces phaeofaciens JCM 4814]|uniref:Uncharacterized protein n=1 Tax=Streptomyces phaeofaciens TaxID=68254 RepID=A0A918HPX0_9ACTN|nr:hypothetical protein GCM10010226_84020 [Streptomyces phaeofaciens]